MIKQNKWKLILSSLLILLPVLFGCCIREHLPEQIASHWGPDGTADGFSSPLTAILLMPLFTLILHWIGILVTFRDNRKNEQNKKINNSYSFSYSCRAFGLHIRSLEYWS